MKFLKSDEFLSGLKSVGSCLGAALVLSACGGGSDLACGKGTVQSGDQCVAKAAVNKKPDGGTDAGADGNTDSSVPDAGGGGGAGGGGSRDAGVDAGAPDEITFGGITSASPASSTPAKVVDGGATAPDSIRVTWNPATYAKDPAATIHYLVESATTKGAESKGSAYTAPPGSTSYTFEGLNAGTKYFFKVVAVVDAVPTAVDKVGPTKELSATPAYDDNPPTFGGATSATAAGPKAVLVKWSSPAKDDMTAAAGIVYRVYWSADANGVFQLGAVSPPGASQVVVNGLPQPEQPYYFHAVAVDAAGNADKNAITIQGQTGEDKTAPVFGGCISVSDASATEATVTWIPAFDDTTPADQIVYKVYASNVPIRHDTQFNALQVVGTFTGGTSGRVSGLLAASQYNFICHALDAFANEDDNRVIQTVKTKNDGTPPTFPGVTTADPDPAIVAINLTWPQATDDQSAQGAIVYNIYASLAPGGEDFTKPLTTATGGVLGKTITKDVLQQVSPHASNTLFYFVVRAEDETGNIEKNTTEVSATTLVSFEDDVQPIFSGNCAILVCHTTGADGTNPPIQGQDLDDGAAYSNIVNVVAREGQSIGEPFIKRIDGTSKTPHDSYLWRKINGVDIFGSQMPPAAAQRTLSQQQKDTIQSWIEQGAPQN